MQDLILLVTFIIFIIFIFGVLVGVRCQEINLRERERRLAKERRHVNDQLRALTAYHEANT
jgi:hypothetical protein